MGLALDEKEVLAQLLSIEKLARAVTHQAFVEAKSWQEGEAKRLVVIKEKAKVEMKKEVMVKFIKYGFAFR